MIARKLRDAQDIMEIAMDDAGLEWKDLDKILLVGGSTRIPAIQDMITKVTGITPSHEINPDEAVALGAAYYAETLNEAESEKKQEKEYVVSDVNSHSLGILAVDADGKMENSIVIKRNSKLPVEMSSSFSTVFDDQEEIELSVVEGEDTDPEFCTIIGHTILKLNKHPSGSPINIVMQYDTNGVVHVRVTDLVDLIDLGEMEIKRTANLTEDNILDKESRMLGLNIN